MKQVPLILCCYLAIAAVAFTAEPKRPNILFVFADDWGRFASAYAKLDGPGTMNDLVQTPNFDRIASEGVLFRRAFVSAPSCTPCRSAFRVSIFGEPAAPPFCAVLCGTDRSLHFHCCWANRVITSASPIKSGALGFLATHLLEQASSRTRKLVGASITFQRQLQSLPLAA